MPSGYEEMSFTPNCDIAIEASSTMNTLKKGDAVYVEYLAPDSGTLTVANDFSHSPVSINNKITYLFQAGSKIEAVNDNLNGLYLRVQPFLA